MIVADTNVVSKFMKDYPDHGVFMGARTLYPADLPISVITVEEIERGLDRLPHGLRRSKLEQRWHRFLDVPRDTDIAQGFIARVPLASGLLSGKYDESTRFAPSDHRTDNRHGEAFSGVPYDVGVAAAREVAALTPQGASTAQFALRWIIYQPGVSCSPAPRRRPVRRVRSGTFAPDVGARK